MFKLLKRFSITYDSVWGQFYILPGLSVTHDKFLNGYYEVSVWWFDRVLSLRYESKNL